MAPRNRQPPESRTLRWRLRMRTYRARQLASLAAARRCGTWRSALIARVSGSEGGWSPRTTGTLSGRLDCRAPRWRFLKHHSYRFQSFRRGRHTEIQRPIGAHVWCHRPADAAAGNGRFPACRTGGRRPACRTTPSVDDARRPALACGAAGSRTPGRHPDAGTRAERFFRASSVSAFRLFGSAKALLAA
jgi:hypothetical protein